MTDLEFRKSSRCESHGCVEVALHSADTPVMVRDSKDLTIPPLTFAPSAWRDFTAAIKAGQFDT